MDLADIFQTIHRRWRSFVVGALLALLASALTTPTIASRFRSESRVQCREPIPGGIESLRQEGLLLTLNLAHLLPLLQSPQLAHRIEGRLRAEGDGVVQTGISLRDLDLQEVKGTTYYRMAMVDPDPLRAVLGLRLVLEEGRALLAASVAEEIEAARRILAKRRADLDAREAADRGELSRLRSAAGLAEASGAIGDELRELREAVQQRRRRVEELEIARERASEELRVQREGLGEAVTEENVYQILGDLPILGWFRELNEHLVKTQIKLLTELHTKTREHPDVKALELEVEETRRLIASAFEEGQLLHQYLQRAERAVVGEREKRLLAKRLEFESLGEILAAARRGLQEEEERLQKATGIRERALDLARRLEAAQSACARIDRAAGELGLLETADLQLLLPIDPPSTAERMGRTPAQILAFGGVLSILAGLAVAWTRESFDARLHSPKDIEQRARLPLLGVIPAIPPPPGGGSAPLSGAHRDREAGLLREDHGLETFRALVRVLLALGPEARTILIAGAEDRIGKTFIAAGLAQAARQLGYRVGAVDSDAHHPTLHLRLGRESRWGLTDILSGDLPVRRRLEQMAFPRGELESAGGRAPEGLERGRRSALRSCRVLGRAPGARFPGRESSGMDTEPWGGGDEILVVPVGPQRSRLTQLLESPACGALLGDLSRSHDLILIDSASLRATSDALSLASRVDGVILVARAEVTRLDALLWAHRSVAQVGGRLLGVVLNGVGESHAKHPRSPLAASEPRATPICSPLGAGA